MSEEENELVLVLKGFGTLKTTLMELLTELVEGRARIVHDDPTWVLEWSGRAVANCLTVAAAVKAAVDALDEKP